VENRHELIVSSEVFEANSQNQSVFSGLSYGLRLPQCPQEKRYETPSQ
jgi:hypothetical protein